ncbi:MAG: hypothetical protein C0404_04235, partial [Verrucomicrobia bacterium]|nr:hypothetical protein [Verrucomicrobiota bacterium]
MRLGVWLVLGLGMSLPERAWAQYLYQEHYRWRNDDGSESTATWKANADTAITGVTRGTNIRLRFAEVNKYTGSYAFQVAARLEYATSTSGPWTEVGTAGTGVTAFEITSTTGYANQDATTAMLAGTGTFVAGKCVESPGNTSGNIAINLGQYSNFEYCFKATAKASGNTTYYFRLAGFSYQSYTVYAQLTMAAGEANEAPAIGSALTANGSVVAPFSYKIVASGTEPITYGASSLPSGLSLVSGNMITGTPTAVGTYNVGLTATSAWGSDAKTLAITVFANQPPVGSNQTANVVEAGEVLIYLSWSDPDTPLKTDHTFTILSPPSSGTLQSYNERYATTAYPDYWYYRAAVGTGAKSFTWKCRDKDNDSNMATCTINVTANTAPTANNYAATLNSGTQGSCYLSVTHSDAGQTLTYTLVSGPSHGTVTPNPTSSSWQYTSAKDYVGGDSFTWKCNDGVADSGVATETITVNACVPVPQNQTAAVRKDTATDIPASYTGGGGYTYTIGVGYPSHGTLAVTNMAFRYTPTAGYVGPDSFAWNMRYNGTGTTAWATCAIWVKEPAAVSNEWPQYRFDEHRDAVTVDELPATLHLQWRRDLPVGRPIARAYSDSGGYNYGNGDACNVDPAYMPVVQGQTLFVGFNQNDCLAAYNTRTGAEKWRFQMNGPVRVAPVAFRLPLGEERVCVGSDDGWLYCLGASDGTLKWKIRCGPSERKLFGESRLISVWPIRGGPTYCAPSAGSTSSPQAGSLLREDATAGTAGQAGKIIYGGGVWPVEGCFLWAVDATTGAKVWGNERLGNFVALVAGKTGPESSRGLKGLIPYGYPVKCRDNDGQFYLPSGDGLYPRFAFADGNWLQESVGDLLKGSTWRLLSDGTPWPTSPSLVAGSRSFTSTTAASLGVAGTVNNMLAADNRLFAVTTQGSIYCFGENDVPTPAIYTNIVTPLPSVSDQWTTDIAAILSSTGVNDTGIGMVWGIGSGRAMEELVKQSSLHVVGVDSNASVVGTMRTELHNAGLYGGRCAVLESDPKAMDVPPYQAWVVVVESLEGSGFPSTGSTSSPQAGSGQAGGEFVTKLFRVIRPYGGRAWLPLSAAEHTAFQGWVASAGLSNATVLRSGNWTILERTGALAGALEFTASGGTITNSDQLVRSPFGVSWYGNDPQLATANPPPPAPDVTGGRIVAQNGKAIDVYTGIVRTGGGAHSGTKTVSAPIPRVWNPLFDAGPVTGLIAGAGKYGTITTPGAPGGVNYCDYSADMGTIDFGGLGARVGPVGGTAYGGINLIDCMIPADGMYVFALMHGGCVCFGGIMQAVGLYHRDDAESWINRSRFWDRTDAPVEERPIRKAGINFGAPAGRVADDNILWLDVPRHQPGPSSTIATFLTPAEPETYYHHSGWIGGNSARKWVVASGVKNLSKAEIMVSHAVVARPAGLAPVIDGNLADACWDGQAAIQLVWNQPLGWFPLGYNNSRAMARSDQDNLYVAMEIPYSYVGFAATNPVLLSGGLTGTNDTCVVSLLDRSQMGLDGSGSDKEVTFAVTCRGEKIVGGNITEGSWTNDWSGACAGDTNALRYEMALPWSTLKAAGLWGSNLVVNLKWNNSKQDMLLLRHKGYCPLYVGGLRGLGSQTRPYNVKLYFAETEGAAVGERVFNVNLQGNRLLTNLDIAAEAASASSGQAGGQNLALVKE